MIIDDDDDDNDGSTAGCLEGVGSLAQCRSSSVSHKWADILSHSNLSFGSTLLQRWVVS